MKLLLLVSVLSAPTLALSMEFRTLDGSGNNQSNPTQGAASTPLIRISNADYPGDGSGATLTGPPDRPNPRDASNALAAQTVSIKNERGLSGFVWQWGQFLDHDIDLTGSAAANDTAAIPVSGATDPLAPGPIPFERSEFAAGTGDSGANPRQQLNRITAYIDASNVYGSDPVKAADLRTTGGKLATSAGGLLPLDGSGQFMAGDERANEQIGLTAMHTLFVREHNRLVDALLLAEPTAADEQLYQTARKIVGVEIQHITYQEFLPALLGSHAPDPLSLAYDSGIDASIANEFSTALYRFGHSMLPMEFLLVEDTGNISGSVALRDAFFEPDFFLNDPGNIDLLMKGLASQYAQKIDPLLVDDVRNFLFGPPGAGGLDLASLNIQRGRDHGLPDYNSLRIAYGLAPVGAFGDIGSDPAIQAILEALYGSVGNIDAWIGALAEDHLQGAAVGELIAASLVDQFVRLAEGDRFFYLNDSDLMAPMIMSVIDFDTLSLSNIISLNTGISNLQDDVFLVAAVPVPGVLVLYVLGLLIGLLQFRHGKTSDPRTYE